jgi:hypothetical protein
MVEQIASVTKTQRGCAHSKCGGGVLIRRIAAGLYHLAIAMRSPKEAEFTVSEVLGNHR